MFLRFSVLLISGLGCLGVFAFKTPLNSPYPSDDPIANTLYTSFSLRPKHLDPARSFSHNEHIIISEIYEPPIQYHYLKRPYELIPLTAQSLPEIAYYNKNNELIQTEDLNLNEVAYTCYKIKIEPNIYYQPHPAFARNENGQFHYHQLNKNELKLFNTLSDFQLLGSRELTAEDYIYQIKRIAHPKVNSPIYGMMSTYIDGLAELNNELKSNLKNNEKINLNQYSVSGVKLIDRYTYTIKIKGHYPQFIYWLTKTFFAPVPWEADLFYQQQGLIKKNITLDWYPVGTGPFMLINNNPNKEITLVKNPNFHKSYFPKVETTEDIEAGFKHLEGQRLPFLDKIQFSLEKEQIPYWNKFLQGYYDVSGIGASSFDQALQNSHSGLTLSEDLKNKGISLKTNITPSTFYYGFNMEDPIVGGMSEKARALRMAISLALDLDEYINIFLNGRAVIAQGPIPPGIEGFQAGESAVNPNLYYWSENENKVKKFSIQHAQNWLKKAGYPGGIDPKTHHPLILYYDTTAKSGPESQAQLTWMREQFKKIGIELVVRATQYNRFQSKMSNGQAQIFDWGWAADYPDPENFLFLLYGPNGKVHYGGENAANYHNPKFDALFERMKGMKEGPERLAIINEMIDIVQYDAPWIWGIHPTQYSLHHAWIYPTKINPLANSSLKYVQINPTLRAEKRESWNQPHVGAIFIIFFVIILIFIPIIRLYLKKESKTEL